MNPNYIHIITIYNCFRAADNPDSKKDIWYKHVLTDCFYKNAIGRTAHLSTDPMMSNTYTVRIPESPQYKPYREWIKLPEEARKKFFTCSLKDVVIKGPCAEEITGVSPNTSAEVVSRYKPDAFVVTGFSDNSAHPQDKHYRVGG